MTTNYNDDVRLEDFDSVLDEEAFAGLEHQTGDISSCSSLCFNTQSQDPTYQSPFPSNFKLDLTFSPEYGRASDWILPPNLSPYTELDSLPSSASTGIYHEEAWNPFDFPLPAVSSMISNGALISQNPYSSLNSSGHSYRNDYPGIDENSYVSLSAIYEPRDTPLFDHDLSQTGHENVTPGQRTYYFHSKPTSPVPSPGVAPATSQTRTQTQTQFQTQTRNRQPAWGQSRSRGSSSSNSSRSRDAPRRKSLDRKSPLPSGPSLRSTTGIYRTGTSSSSGSFSTLANKNGESKIRNNHNQIEKQYRNRLNSQFEVLLSILPREETVSSMTPVVGENEGDGGGKGGVMEERKVSKAEVLEMAQRHIRKLEREGRDLDGENKVLRLKVEELNRVLVESGGIVMP